jgi:hypothetical protein
MDLTIGILSWGQHKTLINTLTSYRDKGLDRLGDERIIFFQEISEKDKEIAREFDYDFIGSDRNIGIAEAYRALVEQSASDLFLFLENDWLLIEPFPDVQIIQGMAMLKRGETDIVRYRSRLNPGNPLWTRQFMGREYDRPTHLLDALHYREDFEIELFPEIYSRGNGWYRTTSRNANWTNNPHMARRGFLQVYILPKVAGDIEINLQSWWETQNFNVTQGDGLFTHHRIG